MDKDGRSNWCKWVSVGLAVLLWAAACQSSPTSAPSPSPEETAAAPTQRPTDVPPTPETTAVLTLWHSWDAEEEAVAQDLLAEYQAQHPGIAVRLQRVSPDRILPEYEDAALAGEGPDLLAGRSHWIGRLASRGSVAALDALVDQQFWDEFYPFALDGVRYQGQLYAVPYAFETVALYYNRDYVGEPPTTTVAMLELAANWPDEGQAGLAFPLGFYNTVGYLYAFGGQLLDEAGQVTLDTHEVRAWLTWLQQVRQSPGVIAADSYGQADALFKSGSVAMVVNGSWVLSDYLEVLGNDRLGVAPLPMLDPTQGWPTPYVGSRVLMVNPARLSVYPQEILELLSFLGGPLLQRQLAAQQGMIPTWSKMDLSGRPLLQAFVWQSQLGRPRPVDPRVEVLWDPLENLLFNVTSGRVPLDLALQETQQQIDEVLRELGMGTPE